MTLGIEQPAIRTEIYVQLMKQLRNNPDARCEARAWQLLMLCLLTFPPDDDLVNFVLMFLRENAQPQHGNALTLQCHAITIKSVTALPSSAMDVSRHQKALNDAGMEYVSS
jgi:hypothetical protein